MRKEINSKDVAKLSKSFSQVLKVGDNVYVSGQMGVDINSNIPKSLEEQMENLFANANKLFKEMNMHINQVVKANVFVKSSVDLAEFEELYIKNFKFPYPARSLAVVEGLSVEDALVEISFDAIDLSAYQIMNQCDEIGCNDCENNDCEYH